MHERVLIENEYYLGGYSNKYRDDDEEKIGGSDMIAARRR
jgi:hypothetical protein